ncbi:hypothetical protein SAMN05216570_4091 [Dyella sp. OK004]|uniref:hypothetical protein n=1 Tax=Dyella sp. OK004 TaxID=1855292 RepID=UPI0008E4FE77|nr:hypothetical protein [Dyella sp. OK004]SFS19677.1 hypothetical protein SAMN05216570_4091 [Dyella sp. OK004]
MMLPNTSTITLPDGMPTASDTARPETLAVATASPMPPGENPHVDYNLHPLKVASLEHYIEQPDGAERFHVS